MHGTRSRSKTVASAVRRYFSGKEVLEEAGSTVNERYGARAQTTVRMRSTLLSVRGRIETIDKARRESAIEGGSMPRSCALVQHG